MEALQTTRASDDLLVVFRKLVHAENRDDVLKLLVALEDLLNVRCDLVVARADELRIEKFATTTRADPRRGKCPTP